jgi:hypothetical protein
MPGRIGLGRGLRLLALALCSTAHAASAQDAVSLTDHQAVADSAARAWLALVDAREWDAAWSGMAPRFRQQVPQAQWQSMLERMRGTVGEPTGRAVGAVAACADFWGPLAVHFTYRSATESGAGTGEEVCVYPEDGEWYVGVYSMGSG